MEVGGHHVDKEPHTSYRIDFASSVRGSDSRQGTRRKLLGIRNSDGHPVIPAVALRHRGSGVAGDHALRLGSEPAVSTSGSCRQQGLHLRLFQFEMQSDFGWCRRRMCGNELRRPQIVAPVSASFRMCIVAFEPNHAPIETTFPEPSVRVQIENVRARLSNKRFNQPKGDSRQDLQRPTGRDRAEYNPGSDNRSNLRHTRADAGAER